MDFDVFISYSSKDKVVADAICAYLEEKKIRCWYAERDIPAGADWAESIIEALGNAKVFVLVFTDFSNSSKQVLREVNNAVSNGLPIIPFRLTSNEPSGGMKYYLSTVHWLDAMDSELEKSIVELRTVVEAILLSGEDNVDYNSSKVRPYMAETKTESWYKQRLKKVIIASVVSLAMIATAAFFIPWSSITGKQDNIQKYETVTPVVAPLDLTSIDDSESITSSGSYCVYDGEKIFYRSNDDMTLYSAMPDGSNAEKLTEEPVRSIIDNGEYIYFIKAGNETSICRLNKNDRTIEDIYTGFPEEIKISEGRIYYLDTTDGRRLYSMTVDGLDRKCESRIKSMSNYVVSGRVLFFANPDDDNKIYRCDLNGGEPELIKDTSAKDMISVGRFIIYNDLKFKRIYAIDSVSLEEYEIASGRLDSMCFLSGTIVGLDNSSKAVCTIPNGKHTTLKIIDVPSLEVSACPESIYIISKDTSTAYLYSLSGELITEL